MRIIVPFSLVLFAAVTVSAQVTPTEKRAAGDVLKKMEALERSLDVPSLVAELAAPNPERDEVVARAKQLMEEDLLPLSDAITRDPEIGFVEHRAVEKLTSYLRQRDFQIEMGVADLETAFIARYKTSSEGPNLGVILEYDALRGTERAFHGDQHSAQGPVGIAAAVATAEYLSKSGKPGNVVVFGAPGEEMMPPNAKTQMYEAGVFDGMDILVRSHATSTTRRPAPGFGTCCLNIDGVKFIFSGAPAHQMASWNGRNALTAVIKLFNNIDSVRSNIRPEARIQGIITEGGAAPNVVPDRAVADFYIRYPDAVYLETVREFTDNAARAAALATGTKVKIDHYGTARDGISVATLGELAFEYMKRYGGQDVLDERGKPQGYEETGSVSSVIPGIGFTAKSSNAPNHTYEMEADALSEVGHQGFLVDAQAMTALLFDFANNPEYRAKVSHEFENIKALFDEYQSALRQTYKNPTVAEPK